MIKARKLVLLLGDIALLYVALWLTLRLRHLSDYDPSLFQGHLLPFSFVFTIWIIVFFINNLYSVNLIRNEYRFYGYLVQNQMINTLIALAFFYIVPDALTPLKPQTVLLILVLINTVLLLLWRRLFFYISSNTKLSNNVLFIGIDKETNNLISEIRTKPQLGYTVALIINLDNSEVNDNDRDIPQRKELINLAESIETFSIDTVVTTTDPKYSPLVSKYLFNMIEKKIHYYNLPAFYEMLTGKIPVTSLEKSWFIENISYGRKPLFEFIKRAEDLLLASILGVITLPITIVIAALIKLESRGPIFYTQIRTGTGGRTFTAIKFRSMVDNAEQGGQAVWAAKNDKRVTRLGRILRGSRLDEIPQVLNIIRGDMSFVGPRPERPEFIKLLGEQIPFYNERLLVKPGLTGWAQINYPYGDTVEAALVKLQYDLFYIKNRSFTMDVSVVLKTINTVFNRSLGQ